MQITKLEAARRQLVTSIRLLFEGADSIYTLALASWEVLDALCKHQGKLRSKPSWTASVSHGQCTGVPPNRERSAAAIDRCAHFLLE